MTELADKLPAAFQECRKIVEQADADRAVSLSFVPPELQGPVAALYAFDIETARIAAMVSQPLPGEIRLQWWRDRLNNPDDLGQGSPVAQALLATVERFSLPLDAFERFLEARIFDLYNDPMPGRSEFEAYAGETTATVIMLVAMVLDREVANQIADAAGHAGVACLASSALMHEERHRALRQNFVPGDVLASTGLQGGDWLTEDSATLRPARLAIAAYASEHLRQVEAQLPSLASKIRPAILPALCCRTLLNRIVAGGGTQVTQGIGPVRRSWLYWRAMRR
ncbi:phytoene/squalene synthase family protein [Aureimonas fodinaquatilis]|uniref:Phytoene/squalene synthase family protein n=1 Tax=Aureimonas fodinaquatilis TaxID=2565783 RepID=A0A5B0DZ21_9HYPH|nr:phytoene/squalene synthase family protein [Aureimonas fodinaquatilis]